MSNVNIRRAIEKKLALLTPALSTAYENLTFTPVANVPYQRVNLLLADPEDLVKGRGLTKLQGIAQITLFYPQGNGTKDAGERAELVKAHFKPLQTLLEGSTEVQITDTARIATGYPDGDRYVVPISIPWYCYITN
jgi:hypothetical protein